MNTTVQAEIHLQDCIAGMQQRVADDSIHLTVTSIPFEELFTYSGKPEDVGNNGSTVDIERGRFALNMRFVVEQLFRVTAPGCNACIHIQQLLAYKNQHGFSGRRDFRGAMVNVFRAGGFNFVGEAATPSTNELDPASVAELCRALADHRGTFTAAIMRMLGIGVPSEFVIPKDPQAMAQRLNLHSLQFKTGYARNGADLMPAVNDYVLIFQKPGEHPCPPKPIIHRTNPDGWITSDEWVRWASGVWADIDEFDIIDGARSARESDEEKHVCPLQLEVIRRLVKLYTNPASVQPDVTVLDPFMGVGSTASICVQLGRNVVGFELKESYHANAVRNVERARKRMLGPAEETALLFGAA